ncbi:MAG: ribosomal protein L7/L12, partial [Alistipes sp.]|nr:ribosomal protein L7/L12 [Alistipes sp.]
PAPAPKPIAASAATGLFDVVLINPGPTKLAVIKIVKELKKCSLAEAKDIVDLAPKVVLSGVSKEEAKRAEVVFEEIEARYEIRPHKR